VLEVRAAKSGQSAAERKLDHAAGTERNQMEYILLTFVVFDTLIVMFIVVLSGAVAHGRKGHEAGETPLTEAVGESFSKRGINEIAKQCYETDRR
jgi:hypothetical protein